MTEEQFLAEFLPAQGYRSIHRIPGDRWAAIKSFMFTKAILLGDIGDENQYLDRWCYHNEGIAEAALQEWARRGWEGEPIGWHRHPSSGRRRIDGLAEKESINF